MEFEECAKLCKKIITILHDLREFKIERENLQRWIFENCDICIKLCTHAQKKADSVNKVATHK